MARRPRSFYEGLSFRPPEPVAAAARRALTRRAQQPPSSCGMTPVGLARARQLLNRQQLSPQTVDRMVSYFARHAVDKQGSSWSAYGKGRQAWDGWGGDPGQRWATALARRMDAAERRINTAQPQAAPPPGHHRSAARAERRRDLTGNSVPHGRSAAEQRHGQTPVPTKRLCQQPAARQRSARASYHRGSVTKTFTVMSLLQQVDRGLVSLDDPIEKYVPGMPNGSTATLRMLANMTSGIPNYFTNRFSRDLFNGNKGQRKPFPFSSYNQLVDYVRGEKPLFPAGAPPAGVSGYSNTNTVLLGMVIEKATGKSLGKVFKADILDPLKMSQTTYPGFSNKLTKPHLHGVAIRSNGLQKDVTNWHPYSPPAGGMISQIDDLVTWGKALGTGGGLISRKLQRERMKSVNQVPPASPKYGKYALGFVMKNGWMQHDGNVDGYMAYVGYQPATQTVIAVMTNSIDIRDSAIGAPVIAEALQPLLPQW